MKVQFLVTVNVLDEQRLRDFLTERYRVCWHATPDPSMPISEAVLEVMVLSNANPSPDDIGLEIEDYEAWEA